MEGILLALIGGAIAGLLYTAVEKFNNRNK
jgi:hypothetical protein